MLLRKQTPLQNPVVWQTWPVHCPLGQVADALLVVLDVLVAGGQTDLDVIVNVDRLNDGSIEAVRMDLIDDGLDLVLFPDLTGHLAVQGPDDLLNTGDLLGYCCLSVCEQQQWSDWCHGQMGCGLFR